MKKGILSVLKVIIPLGIGIFVIWYQYDQLTAKQIGDIRNSFGNANYFWVLLSVFLGLVSHFSRAYRWKFMMEPLGYKTRFYNNFFGVMIGYVANIILPRFGEVWRCVMVSRYEKNTSFEKLFGTVVAERVADVFVLLAIVITVMIMQIARLKDTISALIGEYVETSSIATLIGRSFLVLSIITVAMFIFWKLIRHSQNVLFIKLRSLITGLFDGLTSILKMKKKWAFLAHTAFIWIMYLAMYYAPFMALPETSETPISGVLASFVMASFSIILVQGGIGVYPIAVAQTLVLYGIPYEGGFAMGWIIWVAQTIMIISFGVMSLILMPIVNSIGKKSIDARTVV